MKTWVSRHDVTTSAYLRDEQLVWFSFCRCGWSSPDLPDEGDADWAGIDHDDGAGYEIDQIRSDGEQLPPLLLLDVDGVINAVHPLPTEWPDYERFVANSFTITWSRTVVGALRDLVHAGEVEARWLTTWERDANRLLAGRLGLPQLTVASIDGEQSGGVPYTGGWWKLTSVRRLLTQEPPGRLIIWIDDDLNRYADAITRHLDGELHRLAFVCPDLQVGLSPRELTQLRCLLLT